MVVYVEQQVRKKLILRARAAVDGPRRFMARTPCTPTELNCPPPLLVHILNIREEEISHCMVIFESKLLKPSQQRVKMHNCGPFILSGNRLSTMEFETRGRGRSKSIFRTYCICGRGRGGRVVAHVGSRRVSAPIPTVRARRDLLVRVVYGVRARHGRERMPRELCR